MRGDPVGIGTWRRTARAARSGAALARAGALAGWLLVGATIGCGEDQTVPGAEDTAADDTAADTATAADEATVDGGGEDSAGDAGTGPDARWTGKCSAGPAFCDDGSACTEDRCDPQTGCYAVAVACEDNDPCTTDLCDAKTGCQHAAHDCDDDNACTQGACVAGQGCALTLIDCGDGDACTADGCSPATGCTHAPLSCQDGITCTVDSCDPAAGCQHAAPPGATCCENAADCEDDNVCTNHACLAGICASTPVFGCCKADADCDDGKPCTKDTCATAAGVCGNAFVGGPGCCQQHLDCEDGDACTLDVCVSSQCGHEPTCCANDAACASGAPDACGKTACTSGKCTLALTNAAACCQSDLGQSGFEPADGISIALEPSKSGVFTIANGSAGNEVHSGVAALRYEVVTTPQAGGKAVARAAWPLLLLPPGSAPTLTFWFRSQLTGGSSADVLRLQAETSVGVFWLWQAPANAGWTKVTLSLRGFAGRHATRALRLAWVVTPGKQLWIGSKAWIDDIALVTSCTTPACAVDADCDDKLGATTETCAGGLCTYKVGGSYCESASPCNDNNNCTTDSCGPDFGCAHVQLANCCTKTADCLDDNPCTTDLCSGLQCKHTALPGSLCCHQVGDCDDGNPCTKDSCPSVGLPCQWTQTDPLCCASDLACDDGKPCTLDLCLSNACVHKEQCCTADADCVDGDKCTGDVCQGGLCAWPPQELEGCCVQQVSKQDLEDGKLGPWTLQSELATSKWQVLSGKQAKSGKGALYYGNLAKGNFDDGTSTGSISYKGLKLAAGEAHAVSFWLWMDTEGSTSYDAFEVQVVVDGKKIKLWDKGAPGFALKAWHEVKVQLSAFGGKTVDLVLEFRTNDNIANNGEGVYVDDLLVTRSCAAKTCSNKATCDDGISLTSDQCSAGSCVYSW